MNNFYFTFSCTTRETNTTSLFKFDLRKVHKPITTGHWKPGLRYNQICRLNHVVRRYNYKEIRKLHFVFTNDKLNRNEIAPEIKEKLLGKNVIIFGDSLQRDFLIVLAEVLNLGNKVIGEKRRQHYYYYDYRLEGRSIINLRGVFFYEYEKYKGGGYYTGQQMLSKETLMKSKKQ